MENCYLAVGRGHIQPEMLGMSGATGFLLVPDHAEGLWSINSLGKATKRLTALAEESDELYWVDALLERADIRADPAEGTVQPGLPLLLKINVSQGRHGAETPLCGAFVDVWHCNALGFYSGIPSEGTAQQTFLRGYQVTDSAGDVQFVTVYPGRNRGSAPHIHVRVRLFSGIEAVYDGATRLLFDESFTERVYARFPYALWLNRETLDGASEEGETLCLQMTEDETRAIAVCHLALDQSSRKLQIGN